MSGSLLVHEIYVHSILLIQHNPRYVDVRSQRDKPAACLDN